MKKILGVKRPLKLGVKRPGCETTGNHLQKNSEIQSLGALVYCAAPLRPQSAALFVRAPYF